MSKEKTVIITRKIKISPNYNDKTERGNVYKTLRSWRAICCKAANLIVSHRFIQDQSEQLIYFTDEVKMKLKSIEKDENGMLNISQQNSIYRVLSATFKGEIPTSILTCLSSQIQSSYNKDRKKIFTGEASIRNYKRTIPIPFQASSIRNKEKMDSGDYTFSLFGYDFKTHFGRDLSGNEEIIDKALSGHYKLCDSSIQLDGKDLYLLAVIEFDKLISDVDQENICNVTLDINYPLVVQFNNKKPFRIGDKEEFLHRRLAIQHGLRRSQIAATYNKGGKGIQKKIASIDRYKEAEISYVTSRIHKYSKKLIDLCIKNKSGTIHLVNMPEVKEKTKENDYLLRNWSYYGLRDKIKYKAAKHNILVTEEKSSEKVDDIAE